MMRMLWAGTKMKLAMRFAKDDQKIARATLEWYVALIAWVQTVANDKDLYPYARTFLIGMIAVANETLRLGAAWGYFGNK